MRWWRRNLVLLVPAGAVMAYLIGFEISCPRYVWKNTEPNGHYGIYYLRVVRHEWAWCFWRPLISIDQHYRRDGIYHVVVADKDGEIGLMTQGYARAWP